MKIQRRIKELQNQRNWSTNKLANESGVSLATIISWYTKNATPSLKMLGSICDAFGITLAEFFNESSTRIELTEEEKALLDEWVLLSPKEKEIVFSLIKCINKGDY